MAKEKVFGKVISTQLRAESLRLGNCPDHERVMFTKVRGLNAFVCPYPPESHSSNRGGIFRDPAKWKTRSRK